MDEHIWHHRDSRRHGPTKLTGVVDLTCGPHPSARLLDLVPGRPKKAYRDWLEERGETFREGIQTATLNPFQGYTSTRSTTSSRTPPACWMLSTSSSSAQAQSMTFAAVLTADATRPWARPRLGGGGAEKNPDEPHQHQHTGEYPGDRLVLPVVR